VVTAGLVAIVLASMLIGTGIVGQAQPQPAAMDQLFVPPPTPASPQISAAESPDQRLQRLERVPAMQAPGPSEMPDVAHPPQWTAPLAGPPGGPLTPPDPFTAPALRIDPVTGHATTAPDRPAAQE
jgi:hypothetical protein